MKLSFIIAVLQLSFIGILSAGDVHGQNLDELKIYISLHKATVQESLETFSQKSGIRLSYSNEILQKETKKVNLNNEQLTAGEVLRKILEKTNLQYRLFKNYIVIDTKPVPQQPGRISGKIADERGQSLPGASIKVEETGLSTQTAVDGSFTLKIKPGTYTLLITYISYQPQRITGVSVTEDKNTLLNISLKPSSKGLNEVSVTASYKKASTEGLLTRQKNAAELSNGISADQISKTPDANLGEALKRITGITTIDNKYVVVRGMGERYNTATLDGVTLPSTETSRRAVAFDLIPANLIDNITVSKTITPDMNASFGGGLIQINTKDIPDANFSSFAIGSSFNTLSTGTDFYGTKHGKYDALGFDDGRRDFPKDFKRAEGEELFAQSRLFTQDNISLYTNPAPIAQNYQLTLGRVLHLDTANRTFGIVGSLTYRNNQDITEISDFRRGGAMLKTDNFGNTYSYNTTWGAILNAGLKLKNHHLSFRNTYTRKFENLTSIYDQYYETADDDRIATQPRDKRIIVDPNFLDILQNKLGLQHQFGKLKVDWDIARTSIKRNQKDVIRRELYPSKINGSYVLTDQTTNSTQTSDFPISRHNYLNKETDYNWNIAASFPFTIANTRHTLKSGYSGNQRQLRFDWKSTELNHFSQGDNRTPDSINTLPLSEKIKPQNLHEKGYVWKVQDWGVDYYEGKSRQHAAFLMLDNRFTEQLRLVWGFRAEYYKYTELKNSSNNALHPVTPGAEVNKVPDTEWRWLPSANFTYSPTQQLNIRMAYSRSMIRPEFLERTRFAMYNPELDGRVLNIEGLTSTRIDAADFRVELFPGLGETISLGAFYRYLDKPVELEKRPAMDGRSEYILDNSLWAKNYGLELEFRKKLGFLADQSWLNNFSIFGNATYNKSTVQRIYSNMEKGPDGKQIRVERLNKSKRPLYGQTPYMFNAGLQYEGKHLGINAVFNRTGRKMYIVGSAALYNEYQRPYSQLDAQISYKFLKPNIEFKLNAGNLLDRRIEYYNNSGSYRQATPEEQVLGDENQILKPGYSDNYEQDDMKTFSQRIGRSFSLQVNYSF